MSAYLRTLPLRFTPGSQFGYSNDGYFVLGAIVAAVSGLSFYDYIRQHVFARAGMTSSAFFAKPQIRADDSIALGYATQPGGTRVDATTLPGFPYVGGPFTGGYCTARDLLRFAIALHGGGLLNPAFTNLATTGKQAVSPADLPQGQFYGYGQVEAIAGAHRIVGQRAAAFRDLGDVLEQLKKDSGRSCESIARKTNLSKSTVHRYCTGSAVPHEFGVLERIALVCGAGRDDLVRLHRLWLRASASRHDAADQDE
ncbi:serine hydrolase [Amycolatopsis sp. NPDC058278]|uniref:serine hydrolase n=1 Tax=Amycolatopsis sp. NPDC058278 TaxID=3346417 RepID=UPI0036DC4831